VPIGVAALVAARGLVPAGSTDAGRVLDGTGLALLGIGLPLLLYGATEIGAAGVTSITALAVVAGALLATGFVLGALRTANPLIELRLLRKKTFAAATATTGLTGANMYGGLLLLPLYLQLTAGRNTAETGLLLLAMGLGSALALPLAGTLTDRHGGGLVTLAGAGLLVVTVPFLLPGAFLSSGTLSTTALVLVLIARGTAMALAQMPAMTAAYASVAADEMGDAATLVNIVQRVGGAIGAVGVVVALARAGGGASACGLAFALLTAVSILTLVSAAFLRRHTRTRPGT
jgi:predicted MFS family arabinose efflux permease